MPLARIITRSHQCSRELALDLLARGYTVEVVSPDSIPDNIADLELRVDAGPDNQLIANVEVHNGDRSSSLDFIHHLKTPLADFVRRTPEPQEGVEFQMVPIAFDGEAGVEDLEMPAQVAVRTADVAEPSRALVLDQSKANSEVTITEGTIAESARLISAVEPERSVPEPRQTESVVDSLASDHTDPVGPTIVLRREPHDRSAIANTSGNSGWRWRPAFTIASAVILALIVRFGIGHAGKSANQNPNSSAPTKIASATTDVNLLNSASTGNAAKHSANDSKVSTGDPTKVAAIPSHPSVSSPAANNAPPPNQLPVASSQAATPARGDGAASKHGDGLVARDTVTYLDKKYDKSAAQSVSKKKSAQRSVKTLARKSTPHHENPSKRHSNGIAPDTVTYLDKTPAPKASKQN